MEQVVHTRRSSYRLIPNPRPLLNIYFCLRGTGHQSSPLLIYFRFGPKNCSHCDEDLSTSAAQRRFRNRAEITVLKCEQKSIRHGLRAGQVKELSGVVLNCDHSFSIDNGDGSENVSLKRHSRFFKHCRVYSSPLKISNLGEFLLT